MPEDVYELKCQPTDDNVKNNVLVPYKTSSSVYKDLTFDSLMNNYVFQIVLAIFLMYIFFNIGKYVLKYIRSTSLSKNIIPIRGGKFFR